MNRLSATFIAIMLCFSAALSAPGCTGRKAAKPTRLTIRAPDMQRAAGTGPRRSDAMPADKKLCFGVNIIAADIPLSSPGRCHPPMAVYDGFVASGGSVSLEVARGSDRKVEVFLYLAESGASCPNWRNVSDPVSFYERTYRVGSAVVSLSKDVEEISILAEFPGTANSVARELPSTCKGTPQLRGMLLSSGDIRNAVGEPFVAADDKSAPFWESFFKIMTGQNDNDGLGTHSTAGILNIETTVELPPYLHSLTRKPDDSTLYALSHDGAVVKVNASTGAAEELTSATCPFADKTCRVPLWIQSISAGRGADLFGLDQGGQLYRFNTDGTLDVLPGIMSANVVQISYF